MGMTVKRSKETRLVRVIMHRIADIRGGVSVVTSELTQDFITEGTPLSLPDSNGMCHVVKFAKVKANATKAIMPIHFNTFFIFFLFLNLGLMITSCHHSLGFRQRHHSNRQP